jgi:NAD(P)-dependent dehydrogenase (short-subunit alcohol dehydrogenase family)
MLRTNKHAAAYGAGGAVGGAVARAFAREGAKAFLTGLTTPSVKAVADDIARTGGTVEVAQVDALDEGAVEAHLDSVVQKAGKIDVSVDAITPVAQPGIQSIPLAQLPVDSFMVPIASYLRSHFLTARAAAGRITQGRAGVVLMHTPEPARSGLPLVGGIGPAWAMEALNRNLSAEFTSRGVGAVCSRSTGLPEAHTIDLVFGSHAKTIGITGDQFQAMAENLTHKKRSTSVAGALQCAALLASHKASGLTGTVANLTARVEGRLA